MKMKTNELIGPALDLAVSIASNPPGKDGWGWFERDANGYLFDPLNECRYSPSTDWAQGGPIIEREKISVWWHEEYGCWCAASKAWMEADPESEKFLAMPDAYRGDTPFIAGLRCFVASKLGDEVDIPEELK